MVMLERISDTRVFRRLNKLGIEEASFFSVVIFVIAWLCLGNFWSLVSRYLGVRVTSATILISAAIYLAVCIPVVFFFFFELARLKTRLKWLLALEVLIFLLFVIAPPRNADAMRVWLAKPYDVLLNGAKFIRPYWHYQTPDAFTFFNLPLLSLWDGQVFQFSIWAALCAVLIVVIKISKVYTSDKGVAITLCLFLFNPLIILASTTVITDLPMILAVAGLLYAMILYEQGRSNMALVLVIVFVSFGMNIKYNMLMFLPVVAYWYVKNTAKNGFAWGLLPFCIFFIALAVLPYYINFRDIGNPVWPALSRYFPSKLPYWDSVARIGTDGFSLERRNIYSFAYSFFNLFLMPHYINPLAMCTVFFVFFRQRYLNLMPLVLTSSYLFLLWMMVPKFSAFEYQRYVLYIFPIIIPLGVSAIYRIFSVHKAIGRFKRISEIFIYATVALYLGFTSVYSFDAVKYFFTRDKAEWHKATWYYNEYSWINKNIALNKGEKMLVIVSTQQTFYLRKPYLNADGLSALIDWSKITELSAASGVLRKYNFRYIFVDNDYLESYSEAKKTINLLLDSGKIEKVKESISRLCDSRLRGTYRDHHVVLYKVKG